MKITKSRLKEIIKEEVQNFQEAHGYGDDDDMAELVPVWAKRIQEWIDTQWSGDSDFSSVRAERPAIVAALKKVADDMGEWHTSPEPYSEGKKK